MASSYISYSYNTPSTQQTIISNTYHQRKKSNHIPRPAIFYISYSPARTVGFRPPGQDLAVPRPAGQYLAILQLAGIWPFPGQNDPIPTVWPGFSRSLARTVGFRPASQGRGRWGDVVAIAITVDVVAGGPGEGIFVSIFINFFEFL